MKHLLSLSAVLFITAAASAQPSSFNGLDNSLGSLCRISDAQTRSICPENFTGEKGSAAMAVPSDPIKRNENNASSAARDLGQGWKVNPYIRIGSGETITIAEMEGPGAVQHIWMTPQGNWRFMILRIYWDDEKTPSVECPAGDFFCMGWNLYTQLSSIPVCVNPARALNCYWQMPFRKKCRITVENVDESEMVLYYQIDYTLTQIPDDAAYFHAQFRRTRYNESSDYTIVDGIRGRGQFVGVYLAWGVHNTGWWGEGEAKFYIDGDRDFPTISSTGLEDYFCGSNNFDAGTGHYVEFCTPYSGLCQVIEPDGLYQSQQRFGLYRWHITDPVRFTKDFRMTIQDLGWRQSGRYQAQKSDIAGTAFWYQSEPHAPFPAFPGWRELEIL